ncbi:MAG: tetratricopeptide repeat protein [Treponema sp.]|nr:tetratricopeptide repeat protein [Treponema sp.]
MAKAEAAYNKGNYAECLDILTEFFNNAVTKIDEGLYLQGRALEAPGSSRNIKAALDTYETLVKRYPKSKKWNAANERVIYIKRFYFNIR